MNKINKIISKRITYIIIGGKKKQFKQNKYKLHLFFFLLKRLYYTIKETLSRTQYVCNFNWYIVVNLN